MFKRFMQSNAVQITLGGLIAAYMVFIKYTTRWDIERFDQVKSIIGTEQGFIALTWHSRFLMLNAAWKKKWQLPHVLISRSRDGSIVAHTSHFLGLKTIRGSRPKRAKVKFKEKDRDKDRDRDKVKATDKENITQKSGNQKGGIQASREIKTALENGGCIVITPDGPRGPRQRMSAGAMRLAKLTGAPLIPCTFAVKNRIQFQSWDRFVWPLPFGRGKVIWGTPVYIQSDASDPDIKVMQERIEKEMNVFMGNADRALGHSVTEPNLEIAKETKPT